MPGKPLSDPTKAPWHVYMVRCSDNSLYTGITTDLGRRLAEHNAGKKGARYTRSRRPVFLVYREEAESRSAAAKREYRLKKMPLRHKEALIDSGDFSAAESGQQSASSP
ncbi:GIY-YIG nuclease family protein [Thiovibrio sp. JS02]